MNCNKLMREALEGIEKPSISKLTPAILRSALGGSIGGINVDDKGNISFSAEGAIAGILTGYAVGRYSNPKNIGRDLTTFWKNTTRNNKNSILREMIEPKKIISDAYTPDISEAKRFELQIKKFPRATEDGTYEVNELWHKGKFFLDFDGSPRRWITIDTTKTLKDDNILDSVLNSVPELKKVAPDLETRVVKSYEPGGSYDPSLDYISTDGSNDTLLHETQHAIQDHQGMQYTGSSPDSIPNKIIDDYKSSAMDIYSGDVGEVYARMAGRAYQIEHPVIDAINKQGVELYYSGTYGRLFGFDTSNSKSQLINKVVNKSVSKDDLPEIRRFIREVSKDKHLAGNTSKLEELNFKLLKKFPI